VFNPAGGGFVFQPPKTKLGKRMIQLGQGITDHAKPADSSDYRGWDAGSLPGVLKTRYANLARYAHLARHSRCARNIPGTQDEPLGFASLASAARLMDEILTPIPIDLGNLRREKS
jgi:hypothetical protein